MVALSIGATPQSAFANNYGESLAWQFKSSADRVNQAAVLDLIEKRRGGYYAAPIYTTNIARQVNCSIAATSTGNSGAQSALANSPTVAGATSTATGNSNTTAIDDGHSGATVSGTQGNFGPVAAGVNGATETIVHGTASQALNSEQSNSGDQTASVRGSNACTFTALN
ncbi:MAG: hypothetical protein JWN66_2844 [Sphingomonas bacterium]|uniref:hypothetical protein n=1 Tax=Sphingomonas bacterium TaxID=1895847 RepID=UPI0026026FE2|nr:hypothetical protein [Sphingomonas bacterium]MDB5705728.1 hypothetical protein [Sphingomonas bacterium]